MAHRLTNSRGFNKEGWITRKSVVLLFNADDVIVSMKGGLSPTKASCIRATEACQDPWIPSPSLKTNVTANLASLLFSISPQSKNKKEGKIPLHEWQQGFLVPKTSPAVWRKLMEMSHWMNKTKTSELTHGWAVSACVSFPLPHQVLVRFYQHSTWNSLKKTKKTRKRTSSSLSNPRPTVLALSCPSRSVVD